MAQLTAAQRKELTANQIAYVIWAAQPDEVRQPPTRAEFASALGINDSTAWRWSKDPRVADAIRFVVLQNAGDPGKVTKLLDHVFEVAMGGGLLSMKAAEMWIKAVGLTTQFQRSNSILEALEDDDQFSDFSTEELTRLAEEARAAGVEDVKVNRAVAVLESHGVATDPS